MLVLLIVTGLAGILVALTPVIIRPTLGKLRPSPPLVLSDILTSWSNESFVGSATRTVKLFLLRAGTNLVFKWANKKNESTNKAKVDISAFYIRDR